MINGHYEEGDLCPFCYGALEYWPREKCNCRFLTPCDACVNNKLRCADCGVPLDEVEG